MGGLGRRPSRLRVHIREPRPTDVDAFLAMVRDSQALYQPWVDPPRDAATFAHYLSGRRSVDQAGFFVIRSADDALVGVINVSEIVRGSFHSAYLGYYGSAAGNGQGLMTEGLRLVLSRAFTELGLHRLEANIQPENAPSRALVQRCGFRLEGYSPRYLRIGGQWRDHERWAITVEDWRRCRRTWLEEVR